MLMFGHVWFFSYFMIINFSYSFQQLPHLATTYAAVNSLVTLGSQKALSSINRWSVYAYSVIRRTHLLCIPTIAFWKLINPGTCNYFTEISCTHFCIEWNNQMGASGVIFYSFYCSIILMLETYVRKQVI